MGRQRTKLISGILSLCMLSLGIAPQLTLAAAAKEGLTNVSKTEQAISEKKFNKNVTKVRELTEKRDKYTKHYLNSDGSFTAETSKSSRHYLDSKGKWQDISNKVVPSAKAGFAAQNEANGFQTQFADHSASDILVNVILDAKHEIAWKMDQVQKVDAVKTDSSVTYPNLLPSTDLEYLPYSDGLKENIILKDKAAPNSFKFILETKGLKPQALEDGGIALQDETSGETQLTLPPAYMIDQKQQISNAAKVTLTPSGKPNQYILDIVADLIWLNDPERSFPVIVDPIISNENITDDVGTEGIDTYIAQYSSYKYYNSPYMTTGWDINLGPTRSFIKFPLPGLPTGAIVTDSIFSLYKYTTTSEAQDLAAFRIKTAWSPLELTWDHQPEIDKDNQQTRASLITVPGSHIGWVNFNVWSIVKGWYNGGLENNGFMVAHNQEGNPLFFYRTSNYGTNQPFLSITYITDQTGLNPYWSYANTPVGSANTDNGNFISSVVDFSLPGRGIPNNVTRTYNSRGALEGIFGKKWFSNLDMQLVDKPWGKVLLDSAGTERPFMLKSDGQTYAAPDNYPVQLYKNPDGTFTLQEINESGGYQIELPSVVFAGDGKVIKLLDGKTNTTSVSRVGDKIRLTDASGRVVELTLVNGTVASLKDPSGQEKVSYYYNTEGFLTLVTYKDEVYGDSSLKYSWDKGQLRSLTDKNGTPYYLTYDNLNRIVSVGEINLLGNPSFEAGYGSNLDSWEEKIDYDYGSITEDSSTATTGKGSVHIQSSPTIYPDSSQSFLYVQQTIPIKPSTAYNLSAKLKTGGLNGRAFLNTVQTDVNGTILDSTWKDTRFIALTGTKDWTKQSLSVTTQANAAYLIVYLEVDHDNTHFGGDAYFDEAQLVEGAAAAEFHGHTEIGFGGDGWVTSPLGDVTQYVHNNYGNPIAVISDPGGLNSATRMTWNAADQLTSLTTPSGNTYNYKYDALGNMTKATDPKNNETNYDYYRNRLKTLTQADGKNVQNAWDPVRLDNQTQTDQAGNSKAYAYIAGNLTMESNLLGIADNRIYNSGFNEVDSNNQPLEWARVAPAGSINLSEEDPNAPYGGSRVLKLNPGTNHNTYQWTGFISVADKAKGSYILSGDIKAILTGGASSGAVVYIYWYDASQQPIGSPSSNLYFQVNDPNQSDKWNHYTATDIQPPDNAVYARIMAITYQGATGYFDNLQFEQSPQIRGYNALQNSSFVNGLSKWIRSSSYADVISEVGTINLPSTGSSYLESQTLIPVKQGQDYTLSGNLSTDPFTAALGNGASLQVLIYNQSGTYVQTFKSKVVTEKSELAKYVLPFKSPVNGTAKVRLDVTSAQGIAKFDNIRLGYDREVVTSEYDPLNNYVKETTNQLNKTVRYENNEYGQAISVTSPTGEVIRYAYDGQERLRTVTDNAGNMTTYGLDANGNVLSVNAQAPSGTIYNQSSFVYDDKNNLKEEKNAANSIVSSYAYDANGRLTQKTNASGSTVSLDYGPLGLLKTLKLSSNETYDFSYDLEGRRKQATVSKIPTGPILHTFDYDYDKVGNLISSIEKDGSGAFIGSITKPPAGDMYSKTDELLGFNLKYKTNPDVPYAFLYSPNKLVEKVSAAGKDTLFKYDEGSKLKLQTNPNGVEDRFEYNEGNQLIGTSTIKPGSTNTKITNKYEYDDDGRLKSITRDGSENPTTKYVYNNGTEKLNRLTQAEITDAETNYTLDYSYDPAGNLKSMEMPSGQTNTFAYDGDNKISSLNESAGNVSYDANGNLTKLTVNGKTQQYVYDAADRLITVKEGTGAGTVIASFTYDGDGQRLTKTVGSETITYHYFKGQLMYETSNKVSGQISARYTRTPEGKLLSVSIYTATGIKDYYYHYNAHGDVVAVTDSNGAVYRQYAYDPYGNVISVKDGADDSINMSTDDFNHAYTYAGYRYDKEIGLYFLNARYYNAGIGRFLTKDSVIGSIKNPQTFNRYVYAIGDPINNIDPSGNIAWWIGGGIIGAIGGAIAGAAYSYETTGSVDWSSVAIGAVSGALVGAGLGFIAKGAVASIAGIGGAAAVTTEKVIERASPAAERVPNIQQGLNFSAKAAEHMSNTTRHVPVQIIQQVIKSTPPMLDPRGSNAVMHYSTMYKNNKMYNLEVLYHQATNTVYHFKYTREAIGLLPQILK